LFATGNKRKVKTGILFLKIPKVKSSPTFGQKISLGENFDHISIESSQFEGRFNLIFENRLPINGKSFLGYSLRMFYQKISKKKH
jgi:hypothetical protein